MDNTLMLALQTQRVLQRRMDITANNLANISTSGFKTDELLTEEVDDTGASATDGVSDVRFVRDIGMTRDMGQGDIAMTSNPLDVAIQGGGFFQVQGPNGPLYTRDGAFTMSSDGRLLTADGNAVMGQGGSSIQLDPDAGPPSIGRDGAISQNGNEVAHLGIVGFAHPEDLQKVGDNLWDAAGQAQTTPDGVLVQGALEGSNVRPVVELTKLISISRAYESAAKIVASADELRQQAIQQLGKAA
jgi:flagellar basal-body rod protein FlgF